MSCLEDYVPDSSGRLNASQLNLLREEIMQVFYFQYNHDEHVVINIRHIHQHPTTGVCVCVCVIECLKVVSGCFLRSSWQKRAPMYVGQVVNSISPPDFTAFPSYLF